MKLNQNMSNPFSVKQNFKGGNSCDEVEQWFFYKYYNLCVSRFKWVNLPKEIEPFFIEDVMFWRGKGLFLKDKEIDKYAFMRCNMAGVMDIYNIPEDRYSFANTGYFEKYGKDDSVILWDSPLTMPLMYSVRMYAKAMANLWNTRDINIYAQRTPVIVAMSEEDKLSYENVITKYNQYVPTIKVRTGFDMKNLQVLDLKPPYIVDKMSVEMRSLEAQFLSEIGVESNPIEKKEREIKDEVGGNNGKTEMYRNVYLQMRKRAIKQCNEMWGWNADCVFNSELQTSVNLGEEFGKEEGDDLGNVSNNSFRENNS